MTFSDDWEQIHQILLKDELLKTYHEILRIHSSPIISESIVLLLGNLVSNRMQDRDKIILSSFFERIFELLNSDKLHEGFLRNAIWFCVCLFRTPFSDQIRIKRCANMFINFIKIDDEEVRTECLTGLSKVTEYDNNEIIKMIISSDVCNQIISMQNKKYIVPSIRTLGNLLSSSNQIVDYLIKLDVIPFLQKYLYHKISNVRKESLWALSNITAGTVSQIKKAFDSGVIQNAISMTKDSDREVVREY